MSLRDALRAIRLLLSSQETDAVAQLATGRLILDRHKRLGDFSNDRVELDVSINKEEAARAIIFDAGVPAGIFFEVGGRDGELTYLLGYKGNLEYDPALYRESRQKFDKKFRYIGNDLVPQTGSTVIQGDLCAPDFMANSGHSDGFAAVVYSNNVLEHLKKPWLAAHNIYRALQPGGVCITIAPFSIRYHEAPGDYFRYTHTGISALFEDAGPIELIAAGYDIIGRRNDWQGGGMAKDIVPLDAFGAWRENWFTFHAFRKLPNGSRG